MPGWTRSTIALLLVATTAACSAPRADTPPNPKATSQQSTVKAALAVSVQRVALSNMATRFTASGTVAAWQKISVSASSTGRALKEVLVSEGDLVQAGEVLARLDSDQLEAQVAEQLASIQGQQASLQSTQLADDRGKNLLLSNAISKETAEERHTTLATAQATLAQGQAALKLLQVQLDEATIRAPVAGRITTKAPTLGTVVQTGTELFQISRDDRLEVAAEVPEQYLPLLAGGQGVVVTSAGGRSLDATVRAVAQQVNDTTRLGTVYVSLPADEALRVGMFAKVGFEVAAGSAITVPEAALGWRDGKAGIFAISDAGLARFTPVSMGARQDGRVAIVAGLTIGEAVAIDGVGFLNDGTMVHSVGAGEASK